MVAALILLGEGLRLVLMKCSDMSAIQRVQHSTLPSFICSPVQQLPKLSQFNESIIKKLPCAGTWPALLNLLERRGRVRLPVIVNAFRSLETLLQHLELVMT